MPRLGLIVEGPDGKGFVRSVCGVLLESGWNVEWCYGAHIDGVFRLFMSCYRQGHKRRADITAVEEAVTAVLPDAEVVRAWWLRPLDRQELTRVVITGGGKDRSGIVRDVAAVVTNNNGDIESIYSQIDLPRRRTYSMHIVVICHHTDALTLRRDIKRLAEDTGLSLRVEPDER